MTREQTAFTLIELLIVVAIISILASIAVPNFTEAQTRAKTARIYADMRTLLVGVESYMVDHNVYPMRHSADEILPRLATRIRQMSRITTPIQYLSSLPEDIFATAQRYRTSGSGCEPCQAQGWQPLIDYYDPRQVRQFLAPRYGIPVSRWTGVPDRGWLMASVGPDGVIGAPSNNYLDYPPQGRAMRTLYCVYDPTNGSISFGNIYRFQGDPPPTRILTPE